MGEDKDYQERLIDIIENLSVKEIRKRRLDYFQRVIERTEEFRHQCDLCKNNQETLEKIVMKLEQQDNTYLGDIRTIKIHLLKVHKLLEEGHFLSIGMVYGTVTGIILGLLFQNNYIFLAGGIMIGVAVGLILDTIAWKKKKVL